MCLTTEQITGGISTRVTTTPTTSAQRALHLNRWESPAAQQTRRNAAQCARYSQQQDPGRGAGYLNSRSRLCWRRRDVRVMFVCVLPVWGAGGDAGKDGGGGDEETSCYLKSVL